MFMAINIQVIDYSMRAVCSVLGRAMQGRLNAWARCAVARGPHEHRGPMLIYVCCDLLSINK